MHGCIDAWVHGCMDAWMHGCMDAWMYGCMDAQIKTIRHQPFVGLIERREAHCVISLITHFHAI